MGPPFRAGSRFRSRSAKGSQTMTPVTLYRSILYVPASNARALAKARTLAADGFIVDLEDAVLPGAKPAAREAAAAFVRAGGVPGRALIVRVNALDTPWARDDLAVLAAAGASAVLLPKVTGPEDVRTAAGMLGPGVGLWAMMETPRAILCAREIAAAGPPLAGFVVGTNDLAKDIGCAHPADRAPMTMALQTCVMAARAWGLAVLDGVHVDLDDEDGFHASCRQGRAFGFDGRTLIHPRQIDGANAAYAPAPDEVEQARRVVAAHRDAAARGSAVAVADGRLVEALHVRAAEGVIARAAAVASRAAAGGPVDT